MEGLGRGCILRIARGLSRHASARNPISVSREASFSVSLEAGSSTAHHPPPRPTLPTVGHVPFNASNHPRDLSRTAAQRHKKTDATRGRISTIPARVGHGGGYRPLCPATVTTISAWDRVWRGLLATVSRPFEASALYAKASALYTKASALYIRASATLGTAPAETPLEVPASAPTKFRPRA